MRRKDREMDRDFANYVIDQADFGSLASFSDSLGLINIPLSLVRQGDYLYFHSAKQGQKVEVFKTSQQVAISFVGDVKVPQNYTREELEDFKEDKSKGKELISKVFTTEFASALVQGDLALVEDQEEKILAMRLICEKYTADKMEFFKLAIEAGLDRVNVYRVKMVQVTSKRKKYNSQGQELKYMAQD